jgi:hypothetical protein
MSLHWLEEMPFLGVVGNLVFFFFLQIEDAKTAAGIANGEQLRLLV